MSGPRVTLGRLWIDRWARLLDSPAADGVLALALVAGTWVWEGCEPGKGRLPADALSLTLTALVNMPLAVRRRAPFAVLVVSASTALVYHALGCHPGSTISVLCWRCTRWPYAAPGRPPRPKQRWW
ncbi:hypothetical protein HS048_35130 [Planomonospora sp. ID91781]|uniref:DUF7134 domain-containing protein n=1 Tax=Planomonospora sp. ID91781 TaxID=2738135 RepID=UPI0018C38F5E|nr:hypothetical protein [Planomonospora sp. ID91781]MBG0825909.1 hypothetical protein [Planomonospora sp. ID91781]